MRDRGIQQVRYYIGVEVSPIEVYDRFRDEGNARREADPVPVIGFLFNPFVTRRETSPMSNVAPRCSRNSTVASTTCAPSSSNRPQGWSARRLSTVELFVLNMDFWNGANTTTTTQNASFATNRSWATRAGRMRTMDNQILQSGRGCRC